MTTVGERSESHFHFSMSQPSKKQQNIVHLPQQVNLHQVLLNDVDQFQQLCKTQPDLVPQFVEYADSQLSYIVGFWWLSLDDGQKKEQLEKHPVFAEKYSYQTCREYGSICNRIPMSIRIDTIENLKMKIAQTVTNATSDQQELETFFNVALATGISARNMQNFIKEYKESQSIGHAILKALPESGAIQGNRGDKQRLEQLIFEVKREAELEAKKELEIAQSQARKIVEDAEQKVQTNWTKSTEILTQAKQEAQKLIEDAEKKVFQISTSKLNSKQQTTKTYETEYKQLQKELEELQSRFAELAHLRIFYLTM